MIPCEVGAPSFRMQHVHETISHCIVLFLQQVEYIGLGRGVGGGMAWLTITLRDFLGKCILPIFTTPGIGSRGSSCKSGNASHRAHVKSPTKLPATAVVFIIVKASSYHSGRDNWPWSSWGDKAAATKRGQGEMCWALSESTGVSLTVLTEKAIAATTTW